MPVCTPPAVVKKLVEALYSGYIDLQQDVEQVLVLANCMQVKLVEDVCIGYLLELKLTAEQVSQLMQLWDKLMLYEARKQMLQTHANKAWTGGVMQTLPVLFEKLVHAGPREIELCKEVLFAAECGALSSGNSPCAFSYISQLE